jgi:polyphosphate kinase
VIGLNVFRSLHWALQYPVRRARGRSARWERVEAVTPVEAAPLRARLWEILDVMRRDHRPAWEMRPDGSYGQRQPPEGATGPEAVGTQQALVDLTRRRQAEG